MSAESPRHVRSGGPLTVPSQPPSDRSIIDAVSGFINDVTLSSSSTVDPKDVIQWARFETADINEPTPEGDSDSDVSPLLLVLGYGSGVQVWLIPPTGDAQEVLSWRQGIVRVLRILPTPQHGDCFASKRPLIALCDSASPGPSFCSLSFISIRGGEQVKSIKFKNPILDVLANKRSVVVSFSERFAVFDAATLEDRMSVTTCYPCPCPLGGSLPINPLTLGDRWLAYADKKLNQSKRSSGGCEGEGVTSYTATVLHAAKSLSKGLRGLGESVAHSLAGGRSTSQSPSPPNADIQQPGVVTILDIEGNEEEDGQDSEEPCDPIVAHFIAHSEAIIALKFDPSGMLLVTADRRGHDFHVFRINPHPCGPSLASVHHLYILHRGDTTAKVQDIAVSCDSRWAAVSTLRGTTHVFAVSPYGGACGVRTHTAPRVVNRLSRFHRSAGLPIHTAHKRASANAVADSMSQGAWFPNPRLPPYPLPTTVSPLAQLRPTANIPTHTITRTSAGRQRLSSVSEDSNLAPLLARARFGPAPAGSTRAPVPVAALYLMAANGALLHLLLHPKPLSSIPKEKISDESCIELEVSGVAQWPLQRPAAAADLLAPLPPSNPLLQPQTCRRCADMCMSEEERWLSQVEIVTHAGPHRRLWMGPQFVFKTYNCTGSNSSLSEAETVEVDTSAARGVARSNPVNMPGVRPVVPVLIDSGSASSLEHSPSDSFRRKSLLADSGRAPSVCDVQLREDLAEAMKEDHGAAIARSADCQRGSRAWAVDPLGCVVQPAPPAPREPDAEPDLYATSNCDEATFRPVLRAPAPLPAQTEGAKALPVTTTIPAARAPSAPTCSPPAAQPLSTATVIPAALSKLDINVTEEVRETMDASASVKISVSTERERQGPPETLPKSRPADIQPTESRVRRSPTPKDSDRVASDSSSKDSKSRVRGGSRSRDFGENARASKSSETQERKEFETPVEKVQIVEPEVPIKLEKVKQVEPEAPVKIERAKKVESVKLVKSEKVKKMEPVLKEPASKESTPKQSVPKEMIRGETRSKEAIPKESSNKKSSSKESTVKEPACKESVVKESVRKELSPKESAWKESTPKESGWKEPTPKESAWKESTPKESAWKERTPKESAWKEPTPKESAWKEPTPKESAWKESTPKESGWKEPTPKESAWKERTPKESAWKEPTPKESAWKEPTPKESAWKDPTPKESAWKEPTPKESAWKEPTPKESAWKEPTPKESAWKEPTPKESAWKEPTPKESAWKEPTPKESVWKERTPKESAWKESTPKDSAWKERTPKESAWKEPTPMESVWKETTPKESVWKETTRKESVWKEPVSKESVWKESSAKESVWKESSAKESVWKESSAKESACKESVPKESAWKEPIAKASKESIRKDDEIQTVSFPLKISSKKKSTESKIVKEKKDVSNDDVKTEEQAWDMLLNEPEKSTSRSPLPAVDDKIVEETKPKTKKSRKGKKSQDDMQPKEEEDTFIEIHAIEDKQQESSGELVSISTPYEELEPISYVAKAKKSRSSKSATPEKKDQFETRDIWGLETELATTSKSKRNVDDVTEIGFVPEVNIKIKIKAKEIEPEVVKETLKVVDAESTVATKDSKPRKSKSLSPYTDRKSTEKRYETEVKDVYVIDTMKEEFPEIQITKGKTRKKSPQPEKSQEVEIVEKPTKSWSSIAAAKSVKKEEVEIERKPEKNKRVTEVIDLDEGAGSSTPQVSLQEKLIELCKRTDIMVAECDAPSELNFVDEHHLVLDLPPLEPLDFGLDDFKLEVMRDSLLDVGDNKITSPICKINIDSILSTIKETTNKAIESSAFNLIDLEKMPVKKQRGFSVVENDKITTQEVKIDDDKFEDKDVEVMEKSSDDDNTSPVVSTDSDKEDKKSTGASNVTMPSTKQSSKSKKSRKKKK